MGTDFIVHHPKVKALTLTQLYHLVVDHGNGPEEMEWNNAQRHGLHLVEMLECEEHRMCTVFKQENYQLDPEILSGGRKRLGVQMDDLRVELFACPQQHGLPLYCIRKNSCFYYCCRSPGWCYANTPFSKFAKMLTKTAYEGARMVVCTHDWGPRGEHTHWRNLVERLVVSRVTLPDMAICILRGDKKPLQKPDGTSQLSVIDGTINCVP